MRANSLFTHHTWFYSLTINPGEGGARGLVPPPCLRACFISSPSNQTFELCFCKMVFISFIQNINLRIFNNLKYFLIYTIFKYFSCKSMFIQNIIPRPLMPASKGTVSVISSDPQYKDGNAWCTLVPNKVLSD